MILYLIIVTLTLALFVHAFCLAIVHGCLADQLDRRDLQLVDMRTVLVHMISETGVKISRTRSRGRLNGPADPKHIVGTIEAAEFVRWSSEDAVYKLAMMEFA